MASSSHANALTGSRTAALTCLLTLKRYTDKPQPDTRVGTSAPPAAVGSRGGSTMLNSTDPFYKEFRDLPYHIAIQRLQHYARDARREYTELGSKDLSELKSFVKGLPKLMMLDRLSDIATPVAEQVCTHLECSRAESVAAVQDS